MTAPRAARVRQRIRVFGRVQGVGFRYFCLQTAQEFGLRGWVRNLPDGSVEMEAEGDEAILQEFLAHVGKGSSWARVERTESFPVSALNDPAEDFSIV